MSTILFTIHNGIATITLNRPEKLNAFNLEMTLLLQAKLDECASLREVRCVYLTGAGKAFSAGQDLADIISGGKPSIEHKLSETYNPVVSKIRNMPKPVVAAVNGVAAGAGANIALCCDVVIATSSASFIQAFSKIGLIPDSGGTWILPRLVGYQKALALALTGDKVTAEEAEKMGMVYRCIPDGQFEQEAQQLAMRLAAMPTRGLALTKHVFNRSAQQSFEEQLVTEDEYQQKAAASEDFKEGVTAFLEKRKPLFTGK
jgi:2-(1,2-epoxy-1,2-dihydrophenyl)acetyl-CoA isomerase